MFVIFPCVSFFHNNLFLYVVKNRNIYICSILYSYVMLRKDKKIVEVGRFYKKKAGDGQITTPKKLTELLPFSHTERVKFEVKGKKLVVESLGGVC